MLKKILLRARLLLGFLLLTSWLAPRAHALQGLTGVHDPSTIVKSGNTYWVFATGQGIYCMSSTDLVNWTPGPRTVFVNNAYPSWINTKVPGFAGNFWAPECRFMNGKYYLYYSCSTFGSPVSTIGLATNVTLDPTSPSYQWVDQGEVISTTASSGVNAIDPAIFSDASNNLWLTYGSYFGGIRITQLDATTGKVLNASNQFAVANGGVEAPYVSYNNGYYYLFINRGTCCQGASSTYYIQVGRSATPTGPYLDQNGVSLNSGGGTLLISGAGRFIGPGHTGIFTENGTTYFSHHYYDGYDSGAPKLGLAKLTWGATGWPTVSRDWLAAGRYTIKNQLSNLIWDAWGCTGVAGQMVAQGTPSGLTCQQWDLAPLGNGYYKITNALGGLAVDVIGCLPDAGTKLQLWPSNGLVCQQYIAERASDGSIVFTSATGNRVIEVPNASTTPGQQLGLWDYNGCGCQRWIPALVGGTLAATAAKTLPNVAIYPVPSAGSFTVELGSLPGMGFTMVQVYNLQGQSVYRQQFGPQQAKLAVEAKLGAGIYLVQVSREAGTFTQKMSVL
jgi:arabinan endo-1,5-alpha-L-arabinosidase